MKLTAIDVILDMAPGSSHVVSSIDEQLNQTKQWLKQRALNLR